MPPFVPVAKVIRVRSVWTDDAGTPHGVRQFFSYSGTEGTTSDLTVMASNIIADCWPYLSAQMSTEKTLTEVIIEDLTADDAPVGTSTGTEPGTLSGTYLPASVVFSCNMQIPRRYRGGHPRSALPFGVQASLLNAQQWTAAKVADFTTGFSSYIGLISGAAWVDAGSVQNVNVSYRSGGVARDTPLVTAVTGYTGLQRIGAQRRRLGRSSG
jgi:hypothetical protein